MLREWMSIVKFWSLPISIIPVTVGAALSAGFSLSLYLLMIAGVVSLNFAANMLNDLFDFRHGFDRLSRAHPMKRVNPLASKASTERQIVLASVAFIAIAALCGAYISLLRGPLVILAGLVGVLAAIFYTAGKRNIKSLGLGELLIFAVYGPVITISSFFVESGTFSYLALAASIPVGTLIALILFANDLRDIKSDSDAGLLTMAVRLGAKRSRILFGSLMVMSYASVVVFVAYGLLPLYAAITIVSVPYAMLITGVIASPRNAPSNAPQLSLRFASIFGILLALGIIL